MEYKGYVAAIEYDDIEDILYGSVVNTAYPIVTFGALDLEGLKREFKTSVDLYLESCKEDGVEPEKPYSGKFNLDLGSRLHRKISLLAIEDGMSLDAWIKRTVEEKVRELAHPGSSAAVSQTRSLGNTRP